MLTISADFTPGASLAGGLLIGAAATLHLACNGRLTGLSSIIRGELQTLNPKMVSIGAG
jgi:uncharacterized membrane protein YedE/YeeE